MNTQSSNWENASWQLQNETLLNDELYLGLRQPRARGKEYDEFLEKFVTIARKRFPKAYIHL